MNDSRDIEIAQLREALEAALATPLDVNACTAMEYELRGPEALLVFADSGEIQSATMAQQMRIHAARWAKSIKERDALKQLIVRTYNAWNAGDGCYGLSNEDEKAMVAIATELRQR